MSSLCMTHINIEKETISSRSFFPCKHLNVILIFEMGICDVYNKINFHFLKYYIIM